MNSGLIIFLVVAIAGFGLFTAGIYMLAGSGWSLIAGAASMFAVAGFLRKGLISG